ncbi:MAG: 3-phosphoglycerate dehydrogenase family protein [Leuconostoc mesenteroides]|jgi:D-3-phosphoglycerate dehydrogenase|uniref:D-3-phosphoglycerate dehydrogenase n=1 Tax=Leuconostoc mesenteroides TaxID=1245 RepID=A0A5M8XDE8_LEUME|nr:MULTISPECIES: 3-phosphoglycerate dehydrogenase family protein [Leuconostoc]MDN6081257.1 3-phosphoglycerate dehydrogenase family protein [Leuconostoc sp.]AHF19458.1 Phosphoglycerate dehydrogenase [Leuconostoc mesenteroides KFRI-MG]APE77020.1 3-phosphoglycerate dehydrogenase [Leuconostoc mesenteroides subsp. jonggajibkimchii]ARN63922.1 3-phosphoglycerate dehydrogenase [Leuconostoc mesenteroides subsp. mesenteroides]ASR69440.1 3-phosphoglycerate dehydrogenase [Leuconostoc mesenteroides]
MTNIKTYNAISSKGLDYLKDHHYDINGNDAPKGILLRSQNLHDEPIDDNVRAIVRAGAGFNNIPVEELSKRGIAIFNTPGGNANAVKELTIASLVLAARPVVGAIQFANDTRGGDVSLRTESNKGGYRGTELAGKKLGVIGLGNVGSKVANTALALDMDVIGYDPGLNANTAWRVDRHIVHARSVEEVLEQADYVTVHIPLEEKNRYFIDADKLHLMKPTAALLNLSRGGIVDDEAAKEALDNDQLRVYITDFADSVLFDNPKVIITPHIGGSTIEAEDTSALMAARQLDEYLTTGNIVNSVNYPDINEPFTTKYRVGIIHENVPNMLGQISKFFGDHNINIEQLSNRAVGNYAYTMVAINDFTEEQQELVKTALDEIPHVILTRRYVNPRI